MVNGIALYVFVDIFLVIIAAYFGLQAVKIWKKSPSEDIFKLMVERPENRMRLFYSSLFLGVMMATLSIVHALGYIMEIDVGSVDGPSHHFFSYPLLSLPILGTSP
ncbi:MAG: hypothetical protein ACE5J5_02625 [Candidatus Hydrothermarchaeales archaeon]